VQHNWPVVFDVTEGSPLTVIADLSGGRVEIPNEELRPLMKRAYYIAAVPDLYVALSDLTYSIGADSDPAKCGDCQRADDKLCPQDALLTAAQSALRKAAQGATQ